MRAVFLLLLALTLAACEEAYVFVPTPTPIPSLDTAWGRSRALTWAPTFDAPALATDGETTLLAAFETLDGKPTLVIYRNGLRGRSNITGIRPFSLTVFPAPENGALALWLDDDGSGTQKVYVARLSDTGFAEFAPIAVSSGAAARYAAARLPDGSIWAVWTSPVTGEPTLVGSRIDTEGRPRISQALQPDADYPALAVTNSGNVLLYWLGGTRLDLYRAELTDAGLTQRTEVASAPWQGTPADQLLSLTAALDMTSAYLFWQVRGASGDTGVWMLSTPITGTTAATAQRLAISASEETAQTSFNHGTATTAQLDAAGMPMLWAMPARGQNETLPVAVVMDGRIGIVYLRDGTVAAAQSLVPLSGHLIAPPNIAIDSQRDLVVAWWMPDTPQEAILYVVDSEQ